MSSLDRTVLNAILRQDLYAFVRKVFLTLCAGQAFTPVWFIPALAYQLERVRRGEIRRLIINMPPRSLKSIMASVAFPAFVHRHRKDHREPKCKAIWFPCHVCLLAPEPKSLSRTLKGEIARDE
jgi:hypothetical protein